MEILIGLIGGGFLLLCGWAIAHPHFENCYECKNPFLIGYESIKDKKKYCRKCTRKLGLKPWYHKDF